MRAGSAALSPLSRPSTLSIWVCTTELLKRLQEQGRTVQVELAEPRTLQSERERPHAAKDEHARQLRNKRRSQPTRKVFRVIRLAREGGQDRSVRGARVVPVEAARGGAAGVRAGLDEHARARDVARRERRAACAPLA
jgi:hypothetical protein